MKPLIKQFDATYVPAEWDGINRSGIRVVGKTVLVLMDTASRKSAGEHGGQIEFIEETLEKANAQAISGVMVAVSEGAFCVNEDGSPWSGEKPKPGDRVNIAKYSGTLIPGRDGQIYRLMDYGCIGGVYLPDAEFEEFVASEEKRLNFDPDKAAILRAQRKGNTLKDERYPADTASGLITYRCSELNAPEIDGPPAAYIETKSGARYLYVVHRTAAHPERIDAERELAASVRNALESDLVLAWRVRPEVEKGPKKNDGWRAYCRFVQLPRAEEILPFSKNGYETEAPNSITGGQDFESLKIVPGDHEWDPEDMRCKHCRVKMLDVEDGTSPRECAAKQQSIGAAAAA